MRVEGRLTMIHGVPALLRDEQADEIVDLLMPMLRRYIGRQVVISIEERNKTVLTRPHD